MKYLFTVTIIFYLHSGSFAQTSLAALGASKHDANRTEKHTDEKEEAKKWLSDKWGTYITISGRCKLKIALDNCFVMFFSSLKYD